MNGARMRWYSLSGTRPAGDQRLGAAADRAVAARAPAPRPAASGGSRSGRISARPGPTYQSACATSSPPATPVSFRWTKSPAAGYIQHGPQGIGKLRSVPGRAVDDFAGKRAAPTGELPDAGRCSRRSCWSTIAALLALAAYALSAGGFGVADALLLLFFALTLPWSVIGFWNAAIGFLIMRFARDPVATVLPSRRASARRRADHRVDRDH